MAFVNLTSGPLGQDMAVDRSSESVAPSWWKKALFTLQYGRMLSVVGSFSDETLAEIGIERSDIPAYAKRLIEEPK